MKLSDIKEQLEKCAALGVWNFKKRNTFLSDSPDSHYVEFENFRINLDEGREISWQEAKLLEGLLEQLAESRNGQFDFGHDEFGQETAQLWYINNDGITDCIQMRYGHPTRLQAALAAFLAVDWGK